MSATEAENVAEEVEALLALRPTISLAECASLRRYAWRRSDFPKPDDRLSDTAAAWRKLFYNCDHQLEIGFEPVAKQRIDAAEKRALDLELAQRALNYRIKIGPPESRLGPLFAILAFGIGSAAGWALFHGFIASGVIGILTAAIVTLSSAQIFRDTWSSTFSAAWMNRAGRLLRWQSLADAGVRLINANVLRMREYDETGDPTRIADGIRAADELFVKYEDILKGAFAIFDTNEYQASVRERESHLVEVEMSPIQRLTEANAVVWYVERVRNELLDKLGRENDALDAELLEIARQLRGLPNSIRRDRTEAWVSCARKEYLRGRLAMNILRNRYEFDCNIASAVVAADGRLDMTFEGDAFAQKAASSFWLPEFEQERTLLSAERNRIRGELFGLLS
jgi:hypothetical protein